MNKPIISIVVPTYNVEKYIQRCLDSCLNQSFDNFELIIVDDCGMDRSISIACKQAEQDNRIRIIRNERNMGTYHARRVGVENAIGNYVLFLDPDDELASGSLEKINIQFNITRTNMIFCGVEFSQTPKWYQKKSIFYPKNCEEWILKSFFFQGRKRYVCGTPGKIFKRSFLKNLYLELNVDKDYRFLYAEDVFLLLHAMLRFPSYSKIDSSIYRYHSNDSSITMSKSDDKIIENIKQYKFFLESIIKASEDMDLDKYDMDSLRLVLKKFKSDYFLLSKDLGGKRSYIYSLLKSNKIDPDISKKIRIVMFISSFGRIKL